MTMANWALLTLTGSSAVTDVIFGKIYNGIVLPATVLGLVLAGVPAWGGSGAALAERAANMLIVAAIFLPFWMGLPGSIGAGDIKLYFAVAALLPQDALLCMVLLSLLAAGSIGVLRIVRQRRGAGNGAGRIRIGPAVFCAALAYAGGLYG